MIENHVRCQIVDITDWDSEARVDMNRLVDAELTNRIQRLDRRQSQRAFHLFQRCHPVTQLCIGQTAHPQEHAQLGC